MKRMSMSTNRWNARRLAKALGWFSIGLGVSEVLAPRALGRSLGMAHRAGLLRGYGLRELATGIAILSTGGRARWLWARVIGDALDLVTLAPALRRRNNARRLGAGIATGMVAGIAALDAYSANRMQQISA